MYRRSGCHSTTTNAINAATASSSGSHLDLSLCFHAHSAVVRRTASTIPWLSSTRAAVSIPRTTPASTSVQPGKPALLTARPTTPKRATPRQATPKAMSPRTVIPAPPSPKLTPRPLIPRPATPSPDQARSRPPEPPPEAPPAAHTATLTDPPGAVSQAALRARSRRYNGQPSHPNSTLCRIS